MLLLSFNVNAVWTGIAKEKGGNKHYLDLDKVSNKEGYFYFWAMVNLVKPINGFMSAKVYWKADCKLFRIMPIEYSYHFQPMAIGDPDFKVIEDTFKWSKPTVNSAQEITLKKVCDLKNN